MNIDPAIIDIIMSGFDNAKITPEKFDKSNAVKSLLVKGTIVDKKTKQ